MAVLVVSNGKLGMIKAGGNTATEEYSNVGKR